MAAEYITKFRTDQGDKQVDYNALGNLPVTNFTIHSKSELDELMNPGIYKIHSIPSEAFLKSEYFFVIVSGSVGFMSELTQTKIEADQYSQRNYNPNLTDSEGLIVGGWEDWITLGIVDSALNESSTNAVQNKAVAKAIGDIETALDKIIAIQNTLLGVSE